MSKFKYRERAPETVQARAKQQGGDFDSYLAGGVPILKVKEGETAVRILPPTWDFKDWGDNWGLEVWRHGNIGPDHAAFLCPKKMAEKYPHLVKAGILKSDHCPICDARAEEDDEQVAKDLKSGKRIVTYVIDRDAEKLGPQAWDLGWQLEKEIQVRSQDRKTGEILAIDHPDEGYDVTFTREGQKLKTRYVGVDIAREGTPLSDRAARQEQWLTFVQEHPLTDLLVFHAPEYMQAVFDGKAKPKEETEEETDTKTTRRKPAGKPAKGEAAEDEETDRRPSRSAKAPKAKPKLSEADLDDMEADELAEVVKEHRLDVDVEDFPKEAGLRRAVIKALKEQDLLVDKEEEEEEAEKPKAKTSTQKKLEKVKADDLDDMDQDDLQTLAQNYKLDPDVIDEDSERRTRKNIIAALKEADLLEDDDPPSDAEAATPAERAKAKLQRLKPKD